MNQEKIDGLGWFIATIRKFGPVLWSNILSRSSPWVVSIEGNAISFMRIQAEILISIFPPRPVHTLCGQLLG